MRDEPRVVALVQARMTSSRLPGKVLADLDGEPMLARQLSRLAMAAALDDIVVATTDQSSDDPVCDLARRLGVSFFRGSEADVLGRMSNAARMHRAEIVVRITADCPLIDPQVVDAVVAELLSDPCCDYASNVLDRSYPQGLDVEAVRAATLFEVAEKAISPMAREHVTWHIVREAPTEYSLRSVRAADDHSDLRWTVDTEVDLELIRRIYRELELSHQARGYRQVLEHVLADPDLQSLNQHVIQRNL